MRNHHSYLWALTLVSVTYRSEQTVPIIFHPDAAFASDDTVQFFNQTIYTEQDHFNFPDPLEYGNANEKITNAFYGSINNFGKDRTAFDLNYKGIPIIQDL